MMHRRASALRRRRSRLSCPARR
uniref:Uncharacterized protein n=1 Tax=Arundo donax TaxID=35708 RepID=A0A0A9BN59_ARUDO